ncbi:hypothetical protein L7F22_062814 [Adiantum nelumboides]|nr:hypothetical protein [Adiantum nelumboides]
MTSASFLKCDCNYICKHSNDGWQLVTRRTLYEHRKKDALGKVHLSIAKRRKFDSESRLDVRAVNHQGQDLGDASEARAANHQVQELGAPSRAANAQDVGNLRSASSAQDFCATPIQVIRVGSNEPKNVNRNTWCTCTMYCGGGRQVHLSTYYRHPALTQKYESFKSSFGLSFPPESIQDVEENNEDILHGALDDPIDDDDQSMCMSDHEENDLSPLFLELLERIIELQNLWDEQKVSIGSDVAKHRPELFQPSNKDNIVGEILKCTCQDASSSKKLKRDCLECCEKCAICEKARKSMLSFDYIPIGPQLELLTKSSTYCQELLNLWRHKENWIKGDAMSEQRRIVDFWDGLKFQEVKEFWNPLATYKLPVVCPSPYCKKTYTTFPTCKRSKALRHHVGEEYNFVCIECKENIKCKKNFQKGDPRNVALLLHWDGLQTSRTTQKSCGVVEVMLLNGGMKSSIDILPMLFIPQSGKKILKGSGDVFGTFLRPLVDELGLLFLNGVDVMFEDHGWSSKDMKVVRTLLKSWRVRSEEVFGANSSPLEHITGNGDMLDDVLRHGLHDRILCYIFERLVKAYSSIKTKNMEDEASLSNSI